MHRVRVFAVVCAVGFLSTVAKANEVAPNIQVLTERIEARFKARLPPANVDDGVRESMNALGRIKTPSIAISISESALQKLFAAELARKAPQIRNAKLDLRKQHAVLTGDYSGSVALGPLGEVSVAAKMRANVAPVVAFNANDTTGRIRLAAKDFAVDITRLGIGPIQTVPVVDTFAEGVANGLLKALQLAISSVEMEVPLLVKPEIRLKEPPPQAGIVYKINPIQAVIPLQLASFAVLIDESRMSVVASEASAAAPAVPVANVTYDQFRRAFLDVMARTGQKSLMRSELGLFVNRDLIKELTSRSFAGLSKAPVCLSASTRERILPINHKIALPDTKSINCTPTRECAINTDCAQRQECRSRRECRSKWPQEKFRCEAKKKAEEKACELNKGVRKGQCEAGKKIEAAACEARKTLEKAGCETLKGAFDALRRTGKEAGAIKGDNVALTANATVCLQNVSFDESTLTLAAKLSASGHAKLNGKVKFTPLNVTGHLACIKPFDKDLNTSISLPTQPVDVRVQLATRSGGTRVGMVGSVTHPIRVELPFENLLWQLATDPDFVLSCPLPNTVATIRLLTPDQWWPREARGKIDISAPELSLEFDLVQKPPKIGGYKLRGPVSEGATGVVGDFRLVR